MTCSAASPQACATCGRENCRVAYWESIVEAVTRGENDMQLETAQRVRDAAKVSCFIRAGQRKRTGFPQ